MTKLIFPFPRLFLLTLFMFFIMQSALQAGEIGFAWSPNNEPSLKGYKIYFGTASRSYSDSVDVGNPQPTDGLIIYTLTGLTEGVTYYFAATAYDSTGKESTYSSEIVWTCPVIEVDDEPSDSPEPMESKNEFINYDESDSEAIFTAVIDDLPEQDISSLEEEDLLAAWENHKIARDLYQSLYTMWGAQIFVNIFSDVNRHMTSVGILLDKYGLSSPEDYIGLFTTQDNQDLYDLMIDAAGESTVEALHVCTTIEDMHIFQLQDLLTRTDNIDIQTIYQNMLKGARNHLRLLTSTLNQSGFDYEPQYISVEEFQEIINSPVETEMYDENGEAIFAEGEWLAFGDSDGDGEVDLITIAQMFDDEDRREFFRQGKKEGYQTHKDSRKRQYNLKRKYQKQIKAQKKHIKELSRQIRELK